MSSYKRKPIPEKATPTFSPLAVGLCILFCLLPLVTSALAQDNQAQAIEAATLLAPWPPPGWPAGAKGEVRLVSGDDPGSLVNVLSFPVEDDGSVTYSLPERLPGNLPEAVFMPLKPIDFAFCPEVAPAVSPPGVEIALLAFNLYADGEPWGTVEMFEEVQTGLFSNEGRSILGVLYALQPVAVTGSGTCASGLAVRYDLDLREGPQLLLGRATVNATSQVFTFESTNRFELSQRPVMFGSE